MLSPVPVASSPHFIIDSGVFNNLAAYRPCLALLQFYTLKLGRFLALASSDSPWLECYGPSQHDPVLYESFLPENYGIYRPL